MGTLGIIGLIVLVTIITSFLILVLIGYITTRKDSLLLNAVEKGELNVVKEILSKNTDVNVSNINAMTMSNETLLMAACKGGNTDIVKLLLQNGADVNLGLVGSPFDDADVILGLAGSPLNDAVFNRGLIRSPLTVAIDYGFTEICLLLLEMGANIKATVRIKTKKIVGGTPWADATTPLIMAIKHGNTDIVKALIFKGADVNKEGENDRPIYIAVGNAYPCMKDNHADIIKLLVKNGAGLNGEHGRGETLLFEGLRLKHFDIVKLLIELGANVNQKDKLGQTPLVMAIKHGNTDIVKALISKGAHVNTACKDGCIPLYIAIEGNHTDIINLLVKNGADINRKNHRGETIFLEACRRGSFDIVKLLIEMGADVNQKDNLGQTPLSVAIAFRKADIVKVLFRCGANVSRSNNWSWLFKEGYRELSLSRTEVVKLMIEKGADVKTQGTDGMLPLALASGEGYMDTVKYLLEKVANVNAKDGDDWSALMYASERGHSDIVNILLAYGAKEEATKKMTEEEKTLLSKGIARSCCRCDAVGKKGPWNMESGRVILQKVSSSFYHIVKELPNGWMFWKRCTMRSSGREPSYVEPEFYCPACSKKIQQWVEDYGTRITNILNGYTSTSYNYLNPDRRLIEIGHKLNKLGGFNLMQMASYYAVYTIGRTSEIEHTWEGIGRW